MSFVDCCYSGVLFTVASLDILKSLDTYRPSMPFHVVTCLQLPSGVGCASPTKDSKLLIEATWFTFGYFWYMTAPGKPLQALDE